MKSVHFSTHELAKPVQLEAWREWYADSYEVTSLDAAGQGFAAESVVWRLNGMALAKVSAPALRAARTKSQIHRDPTDHLGILIGRQAVTGLMLGGDWKTVPAGAPVVFSLDEPHVSQRNLDERLQIYIARDQFRDIASALDAVRGQALNTPLGALLSDYLRLVERNLPNLTDDEAERLPQAVGAMVAACVAPSADRMALANGQLNATRKEKVRRYIVRNLGNPELGPNTLSRELGLSRSNLYRLLESEGGATHYIQRLRLGRSYAQLSDPSNAKTVTAIAEELQLTNPSGFSRAFRRQFGMNPTDVREAARRGAPARMAPRGPEKASYTDFRQLLCAF